MMKSVLLPLLTSLAIAHAASASCINRFVNRTERPRQLVTLLTGMLTFPEAEELAKAIDAKQAPSLEWIDENGKSLAKQYGGLKVVRPMPFGCSGRTSGVVIVVAFLSHTAPSKKMLVRIKDETIAFEQQE